MVNAYAPKSELSTPPESSGLGRAPLFGESSDAPDLGYSGVGLLCAFRSTKNFSGVLHLVQLHTPRQWVDSMGRLGVQFAAPGRLVRWAQRSCRNYRRSCRPESPNGHGPNSRGSAHFRYQRPKSPYTCCDQNDNNRPSNEAAMAIARLSCSGVRLCVPGVALRQLSSCCQERKSLRQSWKLVAALLRSFSRNGSLSQRSPDV